MSKKYKFAMTFTPVGVGVTILTSQYFAQIQVLETEIFILHWILSQKIFNFIVRIQASGNIDQVNHQQFQLAFIEADTKLAQEQLAAVFANKSISYKRKILRCQVDRPEPITPYLNGESKTGQLANQSVVLKERVSSLEGKIYSLYQILAIQALIILVAIVYKMFM